MPRRRSRLWWWRPAVKYGAKRVWHHPRHDRDKPRHGPSQRIEAGTYRALIIGVEQRDSPHWQAPPGAKRDAKAIHSMLIDRYGFKAEDATLLLDPTRLQVEEALVFADGRREKHMVFIYFAGHGSYVGKAPIPQRQAAGFLKTAKPNQGAVPAH